ncbi:MAG: multidrug effflux MFS transporter [Lysobacterales bacterium]|nr:multidrug effflux MFS transporter [Xanthomonadales bacterium]
MTQSATAPRPAYGLIALLAGLSMLGPFAIDTFFPAFPAIAGALSATPFQMQQTLALYLVAYALMALLHGGVSDALGRRPVILVSMAIFTLASIGCALSQSIEQLLAFRVLQGLSAGAGVIVGRAIVRDCFEGARAQRVMSGISMIFGIAPALAPIIGGYLLVLGWRASFWFLVLLAVGLLLACWRLLPETLPEEARKPLDARQLSRGYLHMLKHGRFVLLCFAGGFNFAALFLYISSAPAFVLDILKLNELQFGAFFVPTISGMVIGSFASGRMAGRVQPRSGLKLAYALMIIAGVSNILYTHSVDQVLWPWAVLPIALTAFGVAIAFPLLTIACMDLFPDRRGGVSSLQMFLSLLVNASIAGLVAPLVHQSARSLAIGSMLLTVVGMILYVFARSAIPKTAAAAPA